jgi:hypothetical protein
MTYISTDINLDNVKPNTGTAEAPRKNIQKTEKWRAEKCLCLLRCIADSARRGAGLIALCEYCFDDIKLYISVFYFSVFAS